MLYIWDVELDVIQFFDFATGKNNLYFNDTLLNREYLERWDLLYSLSVIIDRTNSVHPRHDENFVFLSRAHNNNSNNVE